MDLALDGGLHYHCCPRLHVPQLNEGCAVGVEHTRDLVAPQRLRRCLQKFTQLFKFTEVHIFVYSVLQTSLQACACVCVCIYVCVRVCVCEGESGRYLKKFGQGPGQGNDSSVLRHIIFQRDLYLSAAATASWHRRGGWR